jgi:hypothetical protein
MLETSGCFEPRQVILAGWRETVKKGCRTLDIIM